MYNTVEKYIKSEDFLMFITSWNLGHSSALDVRPEELVPAVTPAEVQLVWQTTISA